MSVSRRRLFWIAMIGAVIAITYAILAPRFASVPWLVRVGLLAVAYCLLGWAGLRGSTVRVHGSGSN